VSLNTQKSTILTNFCNPEIPGLGRRQSRDSGMVKTAGILGSRDCKHYLQHLSRWAQQLESDNIPKVCYLSRVGCFSLSSVLSGSCLDTVKTWFGWSRCSSVVTRSMMALRRLLSCGLPNEPGLVMHRCSNLSSSVRNSCIVHDNNIYS